MKEREPRRQEKPVMKENQVRHTENLKIFTGKFGHTFYRDGVPQFKFEKKRKLKS